MKSDLGTARLNMDRVSRGHDAPIMFEAKRLAVGFVLLKGVLAMPRKREL